MSASFFNCANLIWLRQLHDRLLPDEIHIQQDINKMVAAVEYSADASLDAAKFAAKAMASMVTSRRLLWLLPWHADLKSKWKLASAPYKGADLFGAALEPILVEGKDKWKVLPVSYQRLDQIHSLHSEAALSPGLRTQWVLFQ